MNIDCVTFFNEVDLLECRLNYLWNLMDYFVIVESNVTHSGAPKRMIFNEVKARFKPYMSKIIYAPYYFDNTYHNLDFTKCSMSYLSPNWTIEALQRNHITTAVAKFDKDDVIFISDVDEIPELSSAQYASLNLWPNKECAAFPQEIFHYYLRFKIEGTWVGTSVAKNSLIQQHGAQWMRDRRWGEAEVPRLKVGGWHLSYFGGISSILAKIKASSQIELNSSDVTHNSIINSINTCSSQFTHQIGQSGVIVHKNYFPHSFYSSFDRFTNLTF